MEDNHWVDMMIDKIGFALTKVDESIQKSIELWKDLTKDIYDEQPTQDTIKQPNTSKSGEEDSSQESPTQHWAMCASKIPESLIQEQGDDEVDEEKEKEKEDDESTVSESSGEEDMCELTLGASTDLSLKWKDGYEQLKDDDISLDDDYDHWRYCYLPPVHPLHKENNALNPLGSPYHMSTNDDTCSKKDDEEEDEDETNSETSYIPSGYHHRNEEDTDSRDGDEMLKMARWRARDGYELLKNDDTSSKDDDDVDDSWVDELMEWMEKRGMVMRCSTDCGCLHGFVDVKKEEVGNKMECGEVETLLPECDWVYVTRDEGNSYGIDSVKINAAAEAVVVTEAVEATVERVVDMAGGGGGCHGGDSGGYRGGGSRRRGGIYTWIQI
ncbi:unnamed protein product [Eruca vesicaria subsp. sativa]|uniref:Uncharacterized protein n=1 Tax=Eruca vesicaria subsp. sativa TaxID=29727 RepID=A0ABC8M119_ERUVS|nr:unnamed protein product [Eruca vesicaria subsp. sativa]